MIFLEIFAMMTYVGFCAMGPGMFFDFYFILFYSL